MNSAIFSVELSRALPAPEKETPAISRRQQIRLHLVCAGRQIARGHFRHVGFHWRGIVRAISGS